MTGQPAGRPGEKQSPTARAAPAAGAPAPAVATWRIEERAGSSQGASVFDVYRGRRRVAWGLTDRMAAERWIRRLGGARPPATEDVVETKEAAPGGLKRVWWSEHG